MSFEGVQFFGGIVFLASGSLMIGFGLRDLWIPAVADMPAERPVWRTFCIVGWELGVR